jgi:histidine ammonia-lyase
VTAEARLLAHPVSFELVTTTHAEGIEERMTMAPLSARRVAEMVDLGERILAIELLIGCQATDLRAAEPLGAGTKRAYDLVRDVIPFMDVGDGVPSDLEPARDLVRSGAFSPSSP